MTDAAPQAGDLETALLVRAKTLAGEYLASARRSRERIVAELNGRLRLREERELLAAKAQSERVFRQQLQAAEIKLQEELDRLRWTMVQAVLDGVRARLAQLGRDEAAYLPLLRRLVGAAASAIEGDLVAQFNQADRLRLAAGWEQFCQEAAPGRRIVLAEEALETSGGVTVYDAPRSVRIDHTFEGRMERLQAALEQVAVERLFAAVPHMGTGEYY